MAKSSSIARDIAIILVTGVLVLSAALLSVWTAQGMIRGWLDRAVKVLADHILLFLPAVVSLLLVWREAILKRRLLQREMDQKKEMQERELELRMRIHEDERKLNEARLAADREMQRAQREAREIEAESVRLMSGKLARAITDYMAADTRWASEALERAKLGTFGKTLFGERVGHFYDEKELIAREFLNLLFARCQRIIESGPDVCILIDSGTTLYPVFRQLGERTVSLRESGAKWLDHLLVVTNNLPGVETLMDVGRINPSSRYSPLAIECRLLPGVPLPVYAAVTGKLASDALEALKAEETPRYFIALVTGNWIRVRRTEPACPIPLARGAGHLEFKQTLVDIADETYVLSPLGKIFTRRSLHEVNAALNFSVGHSNLDKAAYDELKIEGEKARRVRLVTTSRAHADVLYNLYVRVSADLGYDSHESFVTAAPGDVPHVFFGNFDKLPKDKDEQTLVEFPHPATRRRDIQRDYFHVR